MYLCGSNQSRKETLENKRYNNVEEWANTLSHGAGILLGVIAGYFLLAKAAAGAEPKWAVACVTVYLFGMLSSYVSSTWYHGSRPGKLKELLRKFDHGAIYLHIAGTYTPFTLLVMRHAGGWGWGIFSFVWLSAIVGFILSFKKLKEHSNLETICYIAMGACILVAMKPLMDNLAEMGAGPAFWWLIGGGVSYIIGAVFYSLRKPYMHATFHLFCLGGSIGHIIAIWLILYVKESRQAEFIISIRCFIIQHKNFFHRNPKITCYPQRKDSRGNKLSGLYRIDCLSGYSNGYSQFFLADILHRPVDLYFIEQFFIFHLYRDYTEAIFLFLRKA